MSGGQFGGHSLPTQPTVRNTPTERLFCGSASGRRGVVLKPLTNEHRATTGVRSRTLASEVRFPIALVQISRVAVSANIVAMRLSQNRQESRHRRSAKSCPRRIPLKAMLYRGAASQPASCAKTFSYVNGRPGEMDYAPFSLNAQTASRSVVACASRASVTADACSARAAFCCVASSIRPIA